LGIENMPRGGVSAAVQFVPDVGKELFDVFVPSGQLAGFIA